MSYSISAPICVAITPSRFIRIRVSEFKSDNHFLNHYLALSTPEKNLNSFLIPGYAFCVIMIPLSLIVRHKLTVKSSTKPHRC